MIKKRDSRLENEPGTQGPQGPLDDQPQREDEYLSSLLKEFNPERRESKASNSSDGDQAQSEEGGAADKRPDKA